jgi:iron complex transport system permease protein
MRRGALVLVCLGAVAVLVVVVSLGIGPVAVAPADTARILVDLVTGHRLDLPQGLVITELRLPRVLLALLAGAGLAVAGAAMQTYFRNPLADPGVTGVSSGAAVGAVSVLVAGADLLGAWTLPVAAFAGAMAVLVAIRIVSTFSRDGSVTSVLLIGVALNAFCGALTGAIVANADDAQTVRGAMFWLQGDLTSASWNDLALAAAPVVLVLAGLLAMSRDLNVLLLGDDVARSMGANTRGIRAVVLVLASIAIGGIVSVVGVIGFVGLVGPHIVRMLVGSDHRLLIPGSALLGGLFLVAADTVTRMSPGGVAWQTGIITSLAGAPLFLVLVLRVRRPNRVVP